MDKQSFDTKEDKSKIQKKGDEKKSVNCVTLQNVYVHGQKIGVGVEIFCNPDILLEYLERKFVKEID